VDIPNRSLLFDAGSETLDPTHAVMSKPELPTKNDRRCIDSPPIF